MKNRIGLFVLLALLCLVTAGCFVNAEVGEHEVGIWSKDGVSIHQVVTAGRYSDWGWYASLDKINVTALTVTWQDPDLVTRDKQPIGIDLAVTFARGRDSETIKKVWREYRNEAINDDALRQQVLTRIPRVAKGVTTRYTLDEMLGTSGDAGRAQLTNDLSDLLGPELGEIGVILLDVGVNDISVDQSYLGALKEKAKAQIEKELSQQQTFLLQEQLKQEQAQTNIDLERAKRENLVAEEKAKVFEVSDRAYELEKLRLLSSMFNEGDKVYFLPQGTDLTLILGSNIVPLD